MEKTLEHLMAEAVTAARCSNFPRLRELKIEIDQWLIGHNIQDAQAATLEALTEALAGMNEEA